MLDGQPVHLPLALPGDRVVADVGRGERGPRTGEVVRWLERAPRAEPPCPHFGSCGGCRLQHLPMAAYRAWITATITAALGRHNLTGVPVRSPAITPPGTRRRVRLAFRHHGGRVVLGFRGLASHRIVDLSACPVATPAIVALLAPLRRALGGLAGSWSTGEVVVADLAGGLDVVLAVPEPPDLAVREALSAFAGEADLARLSVAAGPDAPPETLAARRPVAVDFAGVAVSPPPGAFLQATADAEGFIREAVEEATEGATRLVDLFSGCGTFTLPRAATGAEVVAVDDDTALLDALGAGARRAGLAARVRTETRDLKRRPLQPAELARFDAAILDPPRAGARAQARTLAASAVDRIAMVSCNPGTFARDARALVDGGFRLLWVQPVDPFLWSAELEVVGALRRDRARPAG